MSFNEAGLASRLLDTIHKLGHPEHCRKQSDVMDR